MKLFIVLFAFFVAFLVTVSAAPYPMEENRIQSRTLKIMNSLVGFLPERMQQTLGWGLLGALIYLVQLVGFEGGAEDRHGSTRLHDAALKGKVEEVIEQIDDYDDIDVTNYHGNTPLHNAVRKGHTKVVKVLLENGADLKIKNFKGKTPIDLAYDKNKILMMLLKAEKEQNDDDDE